MQHIQKYSLLIPVGELAFAFRFPRRCRRRHRVTMNRTREISQRGFAELSRLGDTFMTQI